MSHDDAAMKRQDFVDTYLKPGGVTDPSVLAAFSSVSREKFIPEEYADEAYENIPLPIGYGQTTSQPSLMALMTQTLALTGSEKVLEIGTGSGYQTALLSRLANHVYSLERVKELADEARKRLHEMKYTNVTVLRRDGTKGYSMHAPSDAIIVTAGAPYSPHMLDEQLKEGGRIVIPIGHKQRQQKLKLGVKKHGEVNYTSMGDVIFVPLLGEYGWAKDYAWE